MKILKQSTSKVISFGPFVSPADGVTLVTSLVSALDHASTGIFLSKNGGAFAIRHATVTASTYDAYGNYLVTLDTTDTNTLGLLRVQFAAAATNLVVWDDWMVVPANIYDSLVAGTDLLDISMVQILGTALTETSGGLLSAAFKKFFDKSSPTGTINSIPDAVAGATGGLFIAGTNAATSITTALTANITGNLSGSVGSVTSPVSITAGQLFVKKNTQLTAFEFLMVDSSGNPATGLTVTATRSIDGGAFAACANSVSEVSSGVYAITLANTDLNGTVITLVFTATGAKQRTITLVTQT